MAVIDPSRVYMYSSDFPSALDSRFNPSKPPRQSAETAIARLDIRGVMIKGVSPFSDATDTAHITERVESMIDDDSVAGLLLVIDSPGGSAAGIENLGNAVAELSRKKHVTAFVEDIATSAAFFVATQASRIVASSGAVLGNIGTYAILYDTSGLANAMGVKVHVIRTGPHKGVGVFGDEVTQEQLDEFQNFVEAINDRFISAVAHGRKLSEKLVRGLADGSVFMADEALDLKLIDRIGNLRTAIDSTVRSTRQIGMAAGKSYRQLVQKFKKSGMESYRAQHEADRVRPDLAKEYYSLTRGQRADIRI